MGPQKKKHQMDGPDQGWAWVIAVACFFINFIMAGLARTAGALYVAVIEMYGVSREAATTPFSTRVSVRNITGPIVGLLGQRYGIRPVAAVGGFLAALGGILVYFSPNVFWMTICWGVIHGLGFGLSTILHMVCINQYFDKYHASALGFSYSGDCFGSFALPVIIDYLLHNYDIKSTFLILGAIVLNVIPLSLLLKPPPWLQKTSDTEESEVGDYLEVNDKITYNSEPEKKNDALPKTCYENKSFTQSVTSLSGEKTNHSETQIYNQNSVEKHVDCKSLREKEYMDSKSDLHRTDSLKKENEFTVTGICTKYVTRERNGSVPLMICGEYLNILDSPRRKSRSVSEKKPQDCNLEKISIICKAKCITECPSEEKYSVMNNGYYVNDEKIDNSQQNNRTQSVVGKQSETIKSNCNNLAHEKIGFNETGHTENLPYEGSSAKDLNSESIDKDIIDDIGQKCLPDTKENLSNQNILNENLKNVEYVSQTLNIQTTRYEEKVPKDYSVNLNRIENDVKTTKPEVTFRAVLRTALSTNVKPMFILISLTMAVYCLLFVCVITVIIDFAMDKGISRDRGKYILIAFSGADLIGRISFGVVIDKKWLPMRHYVALTLSGTGIAVVVIPLCATFYTVMACMAFYGIIQGGTAIMFPVLIGIYMERDEESIAMGCMNFYGGILMLAIAPMIGFFRDTYCTYDGMFYIVGILNVLVGISWVFEPLLLKLQNRPKKSI